MLEEFDENLHIVAWVFFFIEEKMFLDSLRFVGNEILIFSSLL